MAISGVTDYTNTYAADRANGGSSLNGDSQAYLNSLKEKYPDVNITVADFKNGKQEDAYMLGSRGYNNIAVSSSIMEKMAKDPAAAAKYEKVFAEMSGNSERIEKFARENNDEILSAGALRAGQWQWRQKCDCTELELGEPGVYGESAGKGRLSGKCRGILLWYSTGNITLMISMYQRKSL